MLWLNVVMELMVFEVGRRELAGEGKLTIDARLEGDDGETEGVIRLY